MLAVRKVLTKVYELVFIQENVAFHSMHCTIISRDGYILLRTDD
jgi:hypothetical protein